MLTKSEKVNFNATIPAHDYGTSWTSDGGIDKAGWVYLGSQSVNGVIQSGNKNRSSLKDA